MKRIIYIILAVVGLMTLYSCLGNNVYDEYKDWRQSNDAWYEQQKVSGQYTVITANWDPSAQVLIRWHNDTMLTRNNLKPLITSTIDTKYRMRLYDNTAVDSSYNLTDSIYRSIVNANVEGWMIALTHMHVGDSCTVIIPYHQGYGSTKRSEVLVPYSNLIFDVKFVDIYKYKAN